MLSLSQIYLILSINKCAIKYFSSHLLTNHQHQKEFGLRDNTDYTDYENSNNN